MISNRSSFIVFCHDKYVKVKDAKSIWYLLFGIKKYHLPKKYLKKYLNVYKLPRIWYSI